MVQELLFDPNIAASLRTVSSRIERINQHYNPKQVKLILENIPPNEFDAIDTTEDMGIEDYLPVAVANWLVKNRPQAAAKYNDYSRLDEAHYKQVIKNWLRTEEYLVGARLSHPPSPQELVKDFFANENGARHRVFYCLRYPDKV
jgi:hypothetical protein